MTRDEILEYIDDETSKSKKGRINLLANRHTDVRSAILRETSFLDGLPKLIFAVRLYAIREGLYAVPECAHPECGNLVGVSQTPEKGHCLGTYCSRSCSRSAPDNVAARVSGNWTPDVREKLAETYRTKARNMGLEDWENYTHPNHFEETQKKRRETVDERYGGYTLQTPEGMRKFTETMNLKYGVDHPMHNPIISKKVSEARENFSEEKKRDIVRKVKATLDSKYGGHHMRLKSTQEKVRSTFQEKYGRGVGHYRQRHYEEFTNDILSSEEAMARLISEATFLTDVANDIGVSLSTVSKHARMYGIHVDKHHCTSMGEREITDILDGAGIEFVTNTRDVLTSKREVDIYVPSKRVGIEYNGVYWHSDKFRDKRYHQDKALDAMEQGIQLIQIWEDDWSDPQKKDILIKKIKAKLGIDQQRVFARKTNVVHPTTTEARKFFNENHIQGHVSCRTIGLEHGGELVAVMGMKRIGDEANGEWDLVRYATSKNVVGGLSKLLSHFKRVNMVKHILTYAHLDYSHGKAYEAVGFTKEHVTVAGMFYVKGDKRHRREKFMKHKLPELLENFDPELTERENMDAHGFKRLYDCGSIKYTWQA